MSMRVRFLSSSLVAGALCASGLFLVPAAVGTASATPRPPSVIRISPISAPAGTSIPIVIHGHGFDTTAGQTTVSFGGTPAVSTSCTSPSKCVAVTPNLSVGLVDVVVTTDGTALNPETLTVTAYSAPVVRIVTTAKGHTAFSQGHLTDGYPAVGGPGFDAFTISNTTASDQTLSGPLVPTTTITAGTSQTFSVASGNGPYIYFTSETPTAALTVKAK
jgi:hypothetical protein